MDTSLTPSGVLLPMLTTCRFPSTNRTALLPNRPCTLTDLTAAAIAGQKTTHKAQLKHNILTVSFGMLLENVIIFGSPLQKKENIA
jgi:hypothetical protein